MARKKGVEGLHGMRKAELVVALENLRSRATVGKRSAPSNGKARHRRPFAHRCAAA